MIGYRYDPNNIWSTTYFHLGEWFTDRDEAIARCEVLRARKITALAKQLERLRRMKFHEEIP